MELKYKNIFGDNKRPLKYYIIVYQIYNILKFLKKVRFSWLFNIFREKTPSWIKFLFVHFIRNFTVHTVTHNAALNEVPHWGRFRESLLWSGSKARKGGTKLRLATLFMLEIQEASATLLLKLLQKKRFASD